MGTIVAWGGINPNIPPGIKAGKELIRISKKKIPKVLFIPTASSDLVRYWEVVDNWFKKLNCETDVLYLLKNKPSKQQLKNKILKADIIYVGGGNTLKLMRKWHYLGVDKLLMQAYNKGAVISGDSAGALCWFNHGHSDSMWYYSPNNWKYIRVKGMGIIPFLGCPHFHEEEKRIKDFEKMVKRHNQIGIGLDNYAAFILEGNKFRVFSTKKGSGVFKVLKKDGKIVTERISNKNFLSINKL